jgi:hypothetical protein
MRFKAPFRLFEAQLGLVLTFVRAFDDPNQVAETLFRPPKTPIRAVKALLKTVRPLFDNLKP